MKLNVLFIADPLSKLKPKSDTSLSLLRQCQKRKYKVFWATESDIEYFGGQVMVRAQACGPCTLGTIPKTQEPVKKKISDFQIAFIRKDPPFDEHYVRLCWILALAEKKVLFVNRPSLLIRYHEKLVPLEAHAEGFLKDSDLIPTYMGTGAGSKEFVEAAKVKTVITKPFLGYGGREISLLSQKEFISKLGKTPSSKWEGTVIQPFQDAVLKEDRRVMVIDGKFVGQFVRVPPPGGFVANLAQGGTATTSPLSKPQLEAIDRISKFLKKTGILFAGVDLIGPKVSEVNITSPTGFVSFEQLYGKDLSENVLDAAEKLLK